MAKINQSQKSHAFDDDKLREECGVFGVYGHKDSSALTALGLHALQHRARRGAPEVEQVVAHRRTIDAAVDRGLL